MPRAWKQFSPVQFFAVSKAVQTGAVGAPGDVQPTCPIGGLFWSHYQMNLYVVQYCTYTTKLYANKERNGHLFGNSTHRWFYEEI